MNAQAEEVWEHDPLSGEQDLLVDSCLCVQDGTEGPHRFCPLHSSPGITRGMLGKCISVVAGRPHEGVPRTPLRLSIDKGARAPREQTPLAKSWGRAVITKRLSIK